MSKIDNVPGYDYMGCFVDNPNRILDAAFKEDNTLTVESCGRYCNGGISPNRFYPYMGVEFGNQCYCGSSLNKTLEPIGDTACSQDCAGDTSQLCGATWFMGVYTATPSGLTSASATATATTTISPSTSTLVSPSKSIYACFIDLFYIFTYNVVSMSQLLCWHYRHCCYCGCTCFGTFWCSSLTAHE